MKTRSQAMKGVVTAMLLTGFVWAGGAVAQQTKQDFKAYPKPSVNAESCQQMDWNKDLLSRYPWAVDACQEVITVNGEKFARFEGHIVRHNRDGSFETQFVNRNGKHVKDWGTMDLLPSPEQHVLLSGEPSHFKELPRNQVLNFYVPEKRFGVAEEPGGALATVVAAPAGQQVAMAEPAAKSQLPKTAGPLPAIALGGLLSLFGALGLTIRRRASARKC